MILICVHPDAKTSRVRVPDLKIDGLEYEKKYDVPAEMVESLLATKNWIKPRKKKEVR